MYPVSFTRICARRISFVVCFVSLSQTNDDRGRKKEKRRGLVSRVLLYGRGRSLVNPGPPPTAILNPSEV